MLYALSIAVAAGAAGGSSELIEPILRKHHVSRNGLGSGECGFNPREGSVGSQEIKSADLITPADHFHLGSNTKAMTATVIAMGVEEGKLSWKSRPLDVFPDLESTIDPAFREITVTDLLTHRAGIPQFNDTDSPEFRSGAKIESDFRFAGGTAPGAPFLDPAAQAGRASG